MTNEPKVGGSDYSPSHIDPSAFGQVIIDNEIEIKIPQLTVT